MTNKKLISLKVKIYLILSIVLIIILSISTIINIQQEKDFAYKQLEHSVTILVESMAKTISTNKANHSMVSCQRLAEAYSKIDGIEEIHLIDTKYKIVASPKRSEIGKTYENPDAIEAMTKGRLSTEFKTEDDEELFDIVVPYYFENNLAGVIEAEVNTDSVNQRISDYIIRSIILIVLTIGIIIGILFFLLSKIIIKPIQILLSVTGEISKGHFTQTAALDSSEEIRQLSEAFNSMVFSLKSLSDKDKSSNPLTGLPGNVVIHEEILKRLKEKKPFSVLYLDINNFKAFNDRYGFNHGDIAINYTVKMARKSILECGSRDDFIGHIGGDDFVIITGKDNPYTLAEHIIKNFNEDIKDLYNDKDKENGYITSISRNGKVKNYPIMTLSIALIDNRIANVQNTLEIGELAAELKHIAKDKQGYNISTIEDLAEEQ